MNDAILSQIKGLAEGFSQITGRPLATLTVDEFIKLRDSISIAEVNTPAPVSVSVPKSTPVSTPTPAPAPKPVTDTDSKTNMLKILQSVKG